ncbi:MAG: methylenetetrahydrofolate reductase, partial [Coriobacteriia bacterium]|nr:methylenetetrahydrofolate reductase [Coriobacteriia bacterium]
MSLRQALESGRFAVTSEVGPPKGTDVAGMLGVADLLRGRVDALNVTDNQAAVMRLCTLAACVHLKQAGHEPVLQVTCRDRNRLAIQSDLLGAASFDISNVLALTGDHVAMGDHPKAAPVFDLESVQLLQVISTL